MFATNLSVEWRLADSFAFSRPPDQTNPTACPSDDLRVRSAIEPFTRMPRNIRVGGSNSPRFYRLQPQLKFLTSTFNEALETVERPSKRWQRP